MSLPWFRLYHEFATDPKVQSMAEAMQRRLVMVMCLHCSEELPGLDDEELATALRISAADLEKTKALFVRKGFVSESWALLKWDSRQFISDDSSARVKKHRAKKQNVSGSCNGQSPLQQRSDNGDVTPPETEADTEADTEKKREANGASAGSLSGGSIRFFDLTPARIALALGQGFTDLAWVEKETIKFTNRKGKKDDGAWLNWLHRGREYQASKGVEPNTIPVNSRSVSGARAVL